MYRRGYGDNINLKKSVVRIKVDAALINNVQTSAYAGREVVLLMIATSISW